MRTYTFYKLKLFNIEELKHQYYAEPIFTDKFESKIDALIYMYTKFGYKWELFLKETNNNFDHLS